MQLLSNIWNWLDGKKTVIGAIIHFVNYGLKGMGLIDQSTFDVIEKIAEFVILGGLAHKGLKMI